MAIKNSIFDVDPDEAQDGGVDDIVARFRTGYQDEVGNPVGLSEFRVTTGDPEVAEALAELMGSDEDGVTTWDTKTEENLQVFTTTSKVDIILDGPHAVRSSLVLWGQQAKILETDGEYLYDDDGNLTDEVWPGATQSLAQMKEAARKGKGPKPSLQAYFRLADLPDIGKIRFFAGAWTAIDNFSKAEAKLAEIDGPAVGTLELERVEFTAKSGDEVRYTKPKLTITGPAPDDGPFADGEAS